MIFPYTSQYHCWEHHCGCGAVYFDRTASITSPWYLSVVDWRIFSQDLISCNHSVFEPSQLTIQFMCVGHFNTLPVPTIADTSSWFLKLQGWASPTLGRTCNSFWRDRCQRGPNRGAQWWVTRRSIRITADKPPGWLWYELNNQICPLVVNVMCGMGIVLCLFIISNSFEVQVMVGIWGAVPHNW